MNSIRRIEKVLKSIPTIEGAGVHLKRVFGYVLHGSSNFELERDPYSFKITGKNYSDFKRESIAWYGPIVMNTQEELRIAFDEFQKGTFLKHKI